MSSFRIKGGGKLKGEIIPQGAKNEALQVICVPLLTAEPVTIHNIPDIVDVNKLIQLIADLGCKVEKLAPGSYRFTATNINTDYLKTEEYRKTGLLRMPSVRADTDSAQRPWRLYKKV